MGSKDEQNKKVYIAASVTQDLIEGKDLKAGALVSQIGKELGGGGGGQPHLATAGGSKPEKLGEVLNAVDKFIKGQL